MPGPRRFTRITVTAVALTAAGAALWGAAIWRPAAPVMADDRSAAVAVSVIAGQLWLGRWLGGLLTGGAVGYLLDAVLNQRAWYRRRLGVTGPLRAPAARHARPR